MPRDHNGDYEVGYRKPPKNSQFKSGKSGNPKGRPKGRKNFETEQSEIFEEPVRINQRGRIKLVSARAAALIKLREKAFSGDVRAVQRFLEFAYRQSGPAADASLPDSDEDLAILAQYEARFGNQPKPKTPARARRGKNGGRK